MARSVQRRHRRRGHLLRRLAPDRDLRHARSPATSGRRCGCSGRQRPRTDEYAPRHARPRRCHAFSVVTAVYNVERYLPDFIASHRAAVLRPGPGRGRRWSTTAPPTARCASSRSGPSGAPTWSRRDLTAQRRPGSRSQHRHGDGPRRPGSPSPTPTTSSTTNYLATVARLPRGAPRGRHGRRQPLAAGTRATERLVNGHAAGDVLPLRPAGRPRGRRRPLPRQRSGGVLPARDRIREHGIRYDDRIRPNFEDGHFCSLYLLHSADPRSASCSSTRYHYRKRADQSSSPRHQHDPPGPLLRRLHLRLPGHPARGEGAARRGARRGSSTSSATRSPATSHAAQNNSMAVLTEGPIVEEFHRPRARGAGAGRPGADTAAPRVPRLRPRPAGRPCTATATSPGATHAVFLDKLDPAQQLVRRALPLHRDRPDRGQVYNGDAPSTPRHAKTRDLDLLRPHADARAHPLAALPAGPAHPARRRVDAGWSSTSRSRSLPTKATPTMVRRYMVQKKRPALQPDALRAQDHAGEAPPAPGRCSPPDAQQVRRTPGCCMDRIHDAGDSGEILFKHLRAAPPRHQRLVRPREGHRRLRPAPQVRGARRPAGRPRVSRSGGC